MLQWKDTDKHIEKMTDDEIAQMMLEERLHNAGIIEKSPFDDEEDDSK